MRICDKCQSIGLTRNFVISLTTSDGQVIDLCREHYDDFLRWLTEQPKVESIPDQPPPASKRQRGRPRKEVTV